MDSTSTWHQFVDSLRKKLVRKEFQSKGINKSTINNTILDMDNNSYSNPNLISSVNNIAVENQVYTEEDHAWFQYYINTVTQEGWDIDPKLWK